MKSCTIYSDKELVLRVVTETVPKEPDYMAHKYWIHHPLHPRMIPGLYDEDMTKYREALQRCKDSSVPLDNESVQSDYLWRLLFPDLSNATFFSLEVGGKLFYRIGNQHYCQTLKPDTFYTVQEFEYDITPWPGPIARIVAPSGTIEGKPDFICDECKFTRAPHEHRCLDPENCKCEDCTAVKEYAKSLRQQSQIPDWIIEYDKKNFQSSAGKAIRILLEIIKKQ